MALAFVSLANHHFSLYILVLRSKNRLQMWLVEPLEGLVEALKLVIRRTKWINQGYRNWFLEPGIAPRGSTREQTLKTLTFHD